ncbi:peptidoglycan/LPS O-acetylase OafA/YrhL [Phycicoccus badiiscoriae]|uniref:Peptidoglycan/LPS O-acetylase OafA/YrhL n=1 Tax=Pedococcus badiiscoriae TaxID=642776 RepID=A0A852WCG7_9MICO|nr:acyltransferase [Pedococcus badiiscoriae]NYG06738.1 peptidoglycan/LPS O-acetylase OafA/YrhL [Pedococcus badiiscoriae]
MTLGEGLHGRDNALNAVRLLLAVLVVLSHTRPVGGFGPDPVIGGRGLGAWAVAGFFAISGYLICASRDRLSWQQFAISRILRIYPGYWLSLVAVAVVFSPAAAMFTGSRFDPAAASRFVLVNLATPVQWTFGEAIGRAARPEAWNAPLWTLTHEMCCYVIAGVALSARRVRRRVALVTGGTLAALTVVNLLLAWSGALGGTKLLDLLHLLGFFTAGSLIWALRDRIRVRGTLAILSLAAVTAIGLMSATDQLAALPVAYLALASGAALPTRIGNKRDLSYGLYIYGWPVETTLYLAGASHFGWAKYTLLSLAVAVPVAWASWACVERPALGLRRRLSSRPARTPDQHTSPDRKPADDTAPAPLAPATPG